MRHKFSNNGIADDYYSILRADSLGKPSLKFCAGATDIEHKIGIGLCLALKFRLLLRLRFGLAASQGPVRYHHMDSPVSGKVAENLQLRLSIPATGCGRDLSRPQPIGRFDSVG
ncbi:hypothetical protein V1289_005718 [Bradyrhizobium sp. AZCC 2289]